MLPAGRELVQRTDDHPGLGGVHLARVQGVAELVVGLQGGGEPEVRAGGVPGLPRRHRHPVRRRGGPVGRGRSGAFGLGQHPQVERRPAAPAPRPGQPTPARCSSGAIDHTGSPASSASRCPARAAKHATGWLRSTGWLLMTQFQHPPPTETPADLRFCPHCGQNLQEVRGSEICDSSPPRCPSSVTDLAAAELSPGWQTRIERETCWRYRARPPGAVRAVPLKHLREARRVGSTPVSEPQEPDSTPPEVPEEFAAAYRAAYERALAAQSAQTHRKPEDSEDEDVPSRSGRIRLGTHRARPRDDEPAEDGGRCHAVEDRGGDALGVVRPRPPGPAGPPAHHRGVRRGPGLRGQGAVQRRTGTDTQRRPRWRRKRGVEPQRRAASHLERQALGRRRADRRRRDGAGAVHVAPGDRRER